MTKSYTRDMEKKKVGSYKRNFAPGVVTASQALMKSQVMTDAKDMWAKGKKSKFAKMLVGKKKNKGKIKRISNPDYDDSVSPEVEDMSKSWHGRDVKGTAEVEEVETYEEDLAELADLEELGIWGIGGDFFNIVFKKDRPKLCCDGEGQNLEVIGGDQELKLDGAIVEHNGKKLIPIGYLYYIVYETDKFHLEGSNGYPESYEHYFGEEEYKKELNPDDYENQDNWFKELLEMGVVERVREEGYLPMVVYNESDGKILLTGGKYEVTELGIRN